MLDTIKDFANNHFKGLVVGGLLTIATLGLWAIWKLFRD